MLKTYEDDGKFYTYNTEHIKDRCVDCKKQIVGDLEQNYLERGNYCKACNAKFGYKKKIK